MEKPVYGGDCLARTAGAEAGPGSEGRAGKAVFVPLTLPGETVTARLVEDKRNFAKAELDRILTASPSRVAPRCPHFGVCGGCHYQHGEYPAQLAMKEQILRETLTRAGVAIPVGFGVLAAEPWGYRNRIRLAVTALGEIGYRGRRSQAIVPIRECPVAAPILVGIAQQFEGFLAENPPPAPVSELELFTNPDETQILATLFCESCTPSGAQSWLNSLFGALPSAAAGIRLQLADGSLNSTTLAACGASFLTYDAAGFAYRVDHGAFFQVNRWLIDDFSGLVTDGHAGELVWDLYAGVGLFARQLAAHFQQVVAVESAPASNAALRQNLAETNSRAIASTTLDFLRHNRQEREPRPELIVLDPPRAGLGDETTSLLNAIHAPRMVYVSCDPATLARDLRALTAERYNIDRVTLVDMFPQTFHIETVVQLGRS